MPIAAWPASTNAQIANTTARTRRRIQPSGTSANTTGMVNSGITCGPLTCTKVADDSEAVQGESRGVSPDALPDTEMDAEQLILV